MKKEIYLLPLNASDKEIGKVVDLLMASEKRQVKRARPRPLRSKKSK